MTPLLTVKGLRTTIGQGDNAVTILENIDLQLARGEVLGLIGESGSGKTMLGLSVLRLEPRAVRITGGSVRFGEYDLLAMQETELRALRGSRLAMIFQDPVGAFNPAKSIGWHMRLALSRARSTEPVVATAVRLLGEVGIPNAEAVLRLRPHQLSGGMLQRALIAMVVGCEPELIVADEPTTNLDALVEQQVIELLRGLIRKLSAAVLYITHDVQIAASLCDRIAVMYAGQIVEEGPTRAIFEDPQHPYTQGLLGTALALDHPGGRLTEIDGELPTFRRLPGGCRFHPRCPVALPVCSNVAPEILTTTEARKTRCVLWSAV